MNIYKITTASGITYTAANSLPKVFCGVAEDFKRIVTSVEQIETGLRYSQVFNHPLPMDIVEG